MATGTRSDEGFTLLEILIAVSLLGVIMLGLSSATFLAYRTIDTTSNSLAASTDAQLLSTYLPADIKSADVGATSGIACIGTTTPTLKLTSSPYTAGGVTTTVVIVYWVRTVSLDTTPATHQYQLVRSVCTTGTKASDVVLARNLFQVTSATATAITGGYKMAITEKKATQDTGYYAYSISGRFRTGIAS